MIDDRIIREDIVAPAIERMMAEMPDDLRITELMAICGAIVNAYGIEGEKAEQMFNFMASQSHVVAAMGDTLDAIEKAKEEPTDD